MSYNAEYFQKYYQENRDKKLAQNRERYKANRDRYLAQQRQYMSSRKAEKAAYDKAYRERHKERLAEMKRFAGKKNRQKLSIYFRAYRVANKEGIARQQREYRQLHRERLAKQKYLHVLLRRARLKAALIVPFTSEQLQQRLSMFGSKCWMCGGSANEVDHVIALARGGAHVLANLRPACGPCNLSKGSKPLSRVNIARVA